MRIEKKIIRIINSLYSRDDIELIDEEKVGEIVAEVRKKRGNKSKIPDPEKHQEDYGTSKFSNISSCSFHFKKLIFFFFFFFKLLISSRSSYDQCW